jgi:hypothetical protein
VLSPCYLDRSDKRMNPKLENKERANNNEEQGQYNKQ